MYKTEGALIRESVQNNETMTQDRKASTLEFLASFLAEIKEETQANGCSDRMRLRVDQALQLATGLHQYATGVSSEVSSDAKLLLEKTSELNYDALHTEGKSGKRKLFKELSSDMLQGVFLKMLVRMTGARRVLEIGTFTGFAALNMAEVLPSDGRLITMEVVPFFAKFSRDFFDETPQKDKIEVQTGDAMTLLNELAKQRAQFDFVFIDADKDNYKNYLKTILDEDILAPKGTLVFDNTIYKGATFMDDFPDERVWRNHKPIREFNEILKNESRVEQVVLPIGDGVTIVRRVGE